MKVVCNTLKDLLTILTDVLLLTPPDPKLGEGILQPARFANGDALAVVVDQQKFGNVITFEIVSSVDHASDQV